MPRSYSQKFLIHLSRQEEDKSLGVRLGRLCVHANIPATYAAVALETTRTTVYSWFRGQGIREKKRPIVEAFIALLEDDLRNGVLPVKNMPDAKLYIERMLGSKI
jgi:hypothetical protein